MMPRTKSTEQPRRRTQAERSESAQRRILNSALRILKQKGFNGATLQDIARGANLTLGALQHQFKSRDLLMEHIADEVMEPLSDYGKVWPPGARELNLEERAQRFVERAWEHLYGTPHYVAAWSLFFGAKSTAPAVFQHVNERRMTLDPLFFQRFADIFPEISSRQGDSLAFPRLVLATLRGIGVMQLFDPDASDIRGELDELVRMIVRAASGGRNQGEFSGPPQRKKVGEDLANYKTTAMSRRAG
jgi:AcrR family transcriptional regulator